MRFIRRPLTWVIFPCWLMITGCQGSQNGLSSSQPSPTSQVTAQPAPQVTSSIQITESAPKTQLETSSNAAGSSAQNTQQQAKTTVTVEVQKAMTALSAEEAQDSIRINLPENILFDFDNDKIRPAAKPALTELSVLLRHYKTAPVTINGHTDNKGSDAYNQKLSERRAQAVKNYLVQNFTIDTGRLDTQGLGESQPIAPNSKPNGVDDPQGRQKNRRVEVVIKTIANPS
jgi:outer membrane protein OmpA-like peptidoglycan-associated protein